jgi:hypothetical protein
VVTYRIPLGWQRLKDSPGALLRRSGVVGRLPKPSGFQVDSAGSAPWRSAGRRARSIAAKLRLRGEQQRDHAQAAVRRITGELAGITQAAMREAAAVIRNARRARSTRLPSTDRTDSRQGGTGVSYIQPAVVANHLGAQLQQIRRPHQAADPAAARATLRVST